MDSRTQLSCIGSELLYRGNESNPYDPTRIKESLYVQVTDDAAYVDPNPGHSYEAATMQVFGSSNTSTFPPPMNGFVASAESMEKGWGPKIMVRISALSSLDFVAVVLQSRNSSGHLHFGKRVCSI